MLLFSVEGKQGHNESSKKVLNFQITQRLTQKASPFLFFFFYYYYFPRRPVSVTDWQKFFWQYFIVRYRRSLWPESDLLLPDLSYSDWNLALQPLKTWHIHQYNVYGHQTWHDGDILCGLLPMKSYDALITWSCEITRQTKTITFPIPQCL